MLEISEKNQEQFQLIKFEAIFKNACAKKPHEWVRCYFSKTQKLKFFAKFRENKRKKKRGSEKENRDRS